MSVPPQVICGDPPSVAALGDGDLSLLRYMRPRDGTAAPEAECPRKKRCQALLPRRAPAEERPTTMQQACGRPGAEGPSPGPGSVGTSGPDFRPAGHEEVNVAGPPCLRFSVTAAEPAAHPCPPHGLCGVCAPPSPAPCLLLGQRSQVQGRTPEQSSAGPRHDSSRRPGFPRVSSARPSAAAFPLCVWRRDAT